MFSTDPTTMVSDSKTQTPKSISLVKKKHNFLNKVYFKLFAVTNKNDKNIKYHY